MKKLCMALSLAAAMAATNLYAALTVTLTEAGGNDNGGGLFQAVTSANGTFDTFCVSIVTTFVPGTQYDYDFSSTIAANVPPTVPTYITEGTAYLYSQFRQNNAHYAGVANADAVQATIWYLQGLLTDSSGHYGLGGVSGGTYDPDNGYDLAVTDGMNTILSQLETDTGLNLAQLEANGNGAYGVVAMNLSPAGSSDPDQPQLAIVPEATTMIAGALLLLPFGASTLRILRKSRKA